DRIELRSGRRETLPLPGRPRWCVIDAAEERLFCAIREPSMLLVAGIEHFAERDRWPLPSGGAHGVDLDPDSGCLFVACDGGLLISVNADGGEVLGRWPLPGVPDATFFNPGTGLVHVAVGDPGVIVSIDPRNGARSTCGTEAGAT